MTEGVTRMENNQFDRPIDNYRLVFVNLSVYISLCMPVC